MAKLPRIRTNILTGLLSVCNDHWEMTKFPVWAYSLPCLNIQLTLSEHTAYFVWTSRLPGPVPTSSDHEYMAADPVTIHRSSKPLSTCSNQGAPLVEFTSLVFTRMPGESYCRLFQSLFCVPCLSRAINSLCSLIVATTNRRWQPSARTYCLPLSTSRWRDHEWLGEWPSLL